jgi:HD-like signal output (HDOD) protein
VAEKGILGFDHAEIAFALCKKWSVPESLSVAIRHHHAPARSKGDKLTHIIHIADSLAMMSGLGAGIDGMAYEMDDQSMVLLGITEEDIPEVMEQMIEAVMQVAESPSGPN